MTKNVTCSTHLTLSCEEFGHSTVVVIRSRYRFFYYSVPLFLKSFDLVARPQAATFRKLRLACRYVELKYTSPFPVAVHVPDPSAPGRILESKYFSPAALPPFPSLDPPPPPVPLSRCPLLPPHPELRKPLTQPPFSPSIAAE